MDLSGFDEPSFAFYVVCNADSTTQVAAIADGIEEKVLEARWVKKVWRIEGQQNAVWIAMDYVDAVVHIFRRKSRSLLPPGGVVGGCADGEMNTKSKYLWHRNKTGIIVTIRK